LGESWFRFKSVKDLIAVLAVSNTDRIGQVDALAQGQLDWQGFLGQGPYQVKANNGKFFFELKEFPKLVSVHLFK
jgi:hypothetical protein